MKSLQAVMTDIDSLYNTIDPSLILDIAKLDYNSQKDREILEKAIKTTINDDVISLVASCYCGELVKNADIGVVCKSCNTEVREAYTDYMPFAWLQKFPNMPQFISPHYILLMDKTLGLQNGNFSLITWFSNKRYNIRLNAVTSRVMNAVKSITGLERSYTYFQQNLVKILSVIASVTTDKKKRLRINKLIDVYRNHKETILSDRLPLPNRRFVIQEKTNKGQFIQGYLTEVVNTALLYIRYKDLNKKEYNEKITGRIISLLANADLGITNDLLSSKSGLWRKNLYGFRAHFSFRAVLTPIVGKHEIDELHIPWKIAIVVLRLHIINIMYNRMNYSYNEITDLLFEAEIKKVDVIWDVIQILLKESGDGIPALLQRNPSQNNASELLQRITYVKENVYDETLSMSLMVMPLPNADVDGDQLNIALPLDKKLADMFSVFKPHNTSLSCASSPGEVFGKVAVPDITTMTISNAIYQQEKLLKG